jgi:hypothetical protein
MKMHCCLLEQPVPAGPTIEQPSGLEGVTQPSAPPGPSVRGPAVDKPRHT